MPIWSEILEELLRTQQGDKPPDFDGVRRRYLVDLQQHSGRNVILYASGWLQRDVPPALTSISDEDTQGLMEVIHGLDGDRIDLILHSPGGSPEATEAIVSYLRSRFSHMRVVVPHLAMSAATMIACASDEIMLGRHSSLGPTDPQLLVQTPLGVRPVPAQSILDQFDRAQRECADPAKLSVWLPILTQYGPDLLKQSESVLRMSKDLVRTWLESYMFKNDSKRQSKAKKISEWLSGHGNFMSHGRHIPRSLIKKHGLRVLNLEDDEKFEDLVMSVFHATTHTFANTPTSKIIENHVGRAFIKQHAVHPVPSIELGIAPTVSE